MTLHQLQISLESLQCKSRTLYFTIDQIYQIIQSKYKMALDKSATAIALGVVVPVVVFVLIILVICLRRIIVARRAGYSQVNHGLDEEEIQFKKSIEMSGSTSMEDDMDGLFDDTDSEEIHFDSKELDRLSMLEKYRNNLVSSAQSSMESNDEKLDSELRI